MTNWRLPIVILLCGYSLSQCSAFEFPQYPFHELPKVDFDKEPILTEAPIIGVLTQELSNRSKERWPGYHTYIAASYVKAVEGAGGRVVPIFTNQELEYYRNIMRSVNGVLLPGGSAKNGIGNPYYDSARNVYKIAEQINIEEEIFPVLAVCLGYEFMITVANNDKNILKECEIFYENYSLKFVAPIENSTLYYRMTEQQRNILETENCTVNYHVWCAYPEDFTKPAFKDWNITSISTPSSGKPFIASVEHRKYPLMGVQFHPEKAAYEWSPKLNFPHDEDSILANRYFYDQLIYFARRNEHSFEDEEDQNVSLIYNHSPLFAESQTGFTQIYIFK